MRKGTSAAAMLLFAVATAAGAETVKPDDVSFEDITVASLTDAPGDAASGKLVMVDRKLGNCLACHQVSDASDHLFQGDVGPALDGVATRYEAPMLRAIVVNAKHVFGDQTIMPGFYTLDVGIDVAEEFRGQTILTAQEVEDVVAYLQTLTQE